MKPVSHVLFVEDNRQKIAASRFDLIVMDIALPGKNGLELTKEIKVNHGDIKIVILTGLGGGYKKAAFNCGADDYLLKGISSLEEILALFDPVPPSDD